MSGGIFLKGGKGVSGLFHEDGHAVSASLVNPDL